jgi:8-amino-7-oxononanoate synthase
MHAAEHRHGHSMLHGLLLQGLVALKRRFGFLLAVDEAHATLVCGANGGGAAEMMGVEQDVDVHIGTLSKAVGAQVGTVGQIVKG